MKKLKELLFIRDYTIELNGAALIGWSFAAIVGTIAIISSLIADLRHLFG